MLTLPQTWNRFVTETTDMMKAREGRGHVVNLGGLGLPPSVKVRGDFESLGCCLMNRQHPKLRRSGTMTSLISRKQ